MSLAPRRAINHFRTPRGNPSSSPSFSSFLFFTASLLSFLLFFPLSLFFLFSFFSSRESLDGWILGCNRDDDPGMINRMIWSGGVEVMVFIEYGDWRNACVREISICWLGLRGRDESWKV